MFLGQEVHYYMVNIAYFIELILQFCDYAQKRRICRENCKKRLTKICMAIFAPDERLPSSATLYPGFWKFSTKSSGEFGKLRVMISKVAVKL